MPYEAKVKTQQFMKSKSNLLVKADQLASLYNADPALIICNTGRYYTYQSTDGEYSARNRS